MILTAIMRRSRPLWLVPLAILPLAACGDSGANKTTAETAVRGLKTILIEEQQKQSVRRYPSVLQPSEITTLSFEIAGRLGENNLKVGQRIKAGETLVQLDRRSLELSVATAQAALDQAKPAADNAVANLKRREELFKKRVTTQAALDDARAEAKAAMARVEEATKQLDSAKENLSKTELKAPYDGIINSVSAESFATVGAGTAIATIYSAEKFEAKFSVNYDINSKMAVGKPVKIRLADNPAISLNGFVSELGSRADTVSSFPVVVRLKETNPELKAGMAVEVSMLFQVTAGDGFGVPLTALLNDKKINSSGDPNERLDATVYLFDPATSTVKRHPVKVGGIRENEVIIVDGLKIGDRVASAGVSFLREGQKVKLLEKSK